MESVCETQDESKTEIQIRDRTADRGAETRGDRQLPAIRVLRVAEGEEEPGVPRRLGPRRAWGAAQNLSTFQS